MDSTQIMTVITNLLAEIDPEQIPQNATGLIDGLDPQQALTQMMGSMVSQAQSAATTGFDLTQLVGILEDYLDGLQ